MYGYIPLGLILAGTDPYGPTGEFAGRKSHRLINFDWLRLLLARRFTFEAAPQAVPAQCRRSVPCSAAASRPAAR